MSAALWRAVFENERPVEIEIGPGRGDVLLALAAANPATNYYGIEIRGLAAEAIEAAARRRALANLRCIAGDARCIIAHLVPPASVQAFHVYFPDPWPKTRHRRRRLFQAGLARALVRALALHGRVHLATDLRPVFTHADTVLEQAGFRPVEGAAAPARPITKFERKYGRAGIHARTYARPAQAADAGSPSPQNCS